MKKKLVNRFLGLIMTGTLILTSAVSPMAAEITVFTEEGTQSEENSYSDFSVTDDEDDSFVTIEGERRNPRKRSQSNRMTEPMKKRNGRYFFRQ